MRNKENENNQNNLKIWPQGASAPKPSAKRQERVDLAAKVDPTVNIEFI